MKNLVLGSAGQIGTALCDHLGEIGDEVVQFDIADNSNQDLRVKDVLDLYIKDVDFVYFLAFDVGGSPYLKKYQYTFDFIDNNMKLMAHTFESIRKYNKRFIFTSSQMSNMSYSPYGVLKFIGEQYTKTLNGLTVKLWNVYGPEKDLRKSHVITDFILKAKDAKQITMLTDGSEARQFLHAKDCSRCLEALAKEYNDISRDREFHITSFEWSFIIEVANIIAEEIGDVKIIPSRNTDSVQMGKRNEPDDFILNYWRPEISLRDGIKEMINHYE